METLQGHLLEVQVFFIKCMMSNPSKSKKCPTSGKYF